VFSSSALKVDPACSEWPRPGAQLSIFRSEESIPFTDNSSSLEPSIGSVIPSFQKVLTTKG